MESAQAVVDKITNLILESINKQLSVFENGMDDYKPLGRVIYPNTALGRNLKKNLNDNGYEVIFVEKDFYEFWEWDNYEDCVDFTTHFIIRESNNDEYPLCIKFINHVE